MAESPKLPSRATFPSNCVQQMSGGQPENYHFTRSRAIVQQPSSPRPQPSASRLQPDNDTTATGQDTTTTGTIQLTEPNLSPPRMMPFSVSLDKFCGDGKVCPEKFLAQYDQFCVLNRLSPEQSLAGLRFYLDGQAKFWFDSLATPPSTLDEAKAQLKAKFKVTECFDYDMFNVHHNSGETVDEYLNKLERKTQKVKLPDSVLVAIALKGLQAHLRVSVIPLEPKDIGELREAARRYERAHQSAGINSATSEISDFKQACTDIIQQLAASVNAVQLQKPTPPTPQQNAYQRQYSTPPRQRHYQQREYQPQSSPACSKTPQQQGEHREPRKCFGCGGESCFSYKRSSCPAYNVICQYCSRLHHTARACDKLKKDQK